jgi:hypothetical protein
VPETFNRTVADAKQILLARPSPHYWRITLDHPPLNIFGPDTIPQLNEVITALETDKQVKVVVFDSAVEGFFLPNSRTRPGSHRDQLACSRCPTCSCA